MNEYKLVMFGVEGAGRTALTIQLERNIFREEYGYDPSMDEIHRWQTTVDNEICWLNIYNTEGEVSFPAIREQYMRSTNVQGVIYVYSITSRSSFDEAVSFREQLLRVKAKNKVPIILVGNQCDLEEEREVTISEGYELANLFGCPFYETSAKVRVNVEEVFHELVRKNTRP